MKLPKARKRGESYRIELMFNGKRISATRDTEKECEQWAALKLLELKTGQAQEEKGIKPTLPFKQLCEKYYTERGSKLKSNYVIRNKLNNIDHILGDLATSRYTSLSQLTLYVGVINVFLKCKAVQRLENLQCSPLFSLMHKKSYFLLRATSGKW